MKGKFTNTLILGILLLILFGAFNLGVRLNFGLVSFDFNKLATYWVFMGLICTVLAYKKNKDPGTGLLIGLLLGPIGIIYYLLCKKGMSEKEKEVYEWEIEKKHKSMLAEKGKSSESSG